MIRQLMREGLFLGSANHLERLLRRDCSAPKPKGGARFRYVGKRERPDKSLVKSGVLFRLASGDSLAHHL